MDIQSLNNAASNAAQEAAVGNGFSQEEIGDASTFVEDAETADIWRQHPEELVPYEMLEKKEWRERVSNWADIWASVCHLPALHMHTLIPQV